MMPICKTCNRDLPQPDFIKSKSSKTGFGNICKPCANARKRELSTQPHILARKAEYVKRNREKILQLGKEYREKNKDILREKRRAKADHKREVDRAYGQANPDKIAAKSARRRAYRLKATPFWANKAEIDKFYFLAKVEEEKTGEKYHVDHIVPLKSKFVCGLHCEFNLQILPGSENCSKSNLVWPDMPDKLDYGELLRDHEASILLG